MSSARASAGTRSHIVQRRPPAIGAHADQRDITHEPGDHQRSAVCQVLPRCHTLGEREPVAEQAANPQRSPGFGFTGITPPVPRFVQIATTPQPCTIDVNSAGT